MDIKGISYEEFWRSFVELADEKKTCGRLEERIAALEAELKRLKGELEGCAKEKNDLKEQNRLMTIHTTAMSLKQLFYMGQYRLSTEKMRKEFERCAKMRDGLTANIILEFALRTSFFETDEESRRLIEGMIPVQPPMAINYNAPINNNGGTLNGDINEPKYE